jgi:SAM-dependent methyltransferase
MPDRLLGRPGNWTIVECESCRLTQTRPRPSRKSIGRFYPVRYQATLAARDTSTRSKAHVALTRLRDAPFRLRYGEQRAQRPTPERRKLLEIGCAAGSNLAAYAAAGWQVRAIERSKELAQIAAERAGIARDRVLAVPAEEAEFDDDEFDLIVMFHVIEHLHDPLAVLRSARRWLRHGGQIEIGCPNYASLERRLFGRYWIGLDLPRHLYHYTPRTLTATLQRASFEVTSILPEHEHVSTPLSISAALDGIRGKQRPVTNSRFRQLAVLPYTVASRAWAPSLACS